MKEVGIVEILLAKGLVPVPAIRIGKFWAAHRTPESPNGYTVSHLATGRQFLGYVKPTLAKRLVGVIDTLIPAADYDGVHAIWNTLPPKVQHAFCDMRYTC